MNEEILQSLRDVHLPHPPSLWPPSLFLSLLIASIILFFVVSAWLYLWGHRRRKIKKFLLKELSDYKKQYLSTFDQAWLQSQICALLRRLLILKNVNKNVSSVPLTDLHDELKKLFRRPKNLDVFIELATKNRFQKDPDIDALHLINLAFEHFKKCRI